MRSRQPVISFHPVAWSRILPLLLALLLGAVSADASQVDGLYSAEVQVAGQSAEQRTEGIVRAFAEMLVKVTGNRTIAGRSELQEALKLAPRYVQQYRYRLVPASGGGDEAEQDASRLLMVQFDAEAVRRLLRERRLPVWGENRPAGIVWLGVESAGQRRLLQPESDSELVIAMTAAAEKRGIPVLFPLMDLEDQSAVQVADLWGNFIQNIRRGSERYSPDLIVTGRLVRLSDRLWRVNWHLYHGDRSSVWRDEGSLPTELAAAGIQRVADLLAERYAPVLGEGSLSLIRLRISGVNSLEQYARVGELLRSQSAVERVEMVAAEPEAVTYELHSRGGVQVLEQGLSLGGVIEPLPELPTGAEPLTEGIDLHYRMR
ncbi:MAG: DUF2066 domain-containing protein [Sedimenticola sp.]|nr:DUF2066 domain-containing protein [Sedimenticola sp.]